MRKVLDEIVTHAHLWETVGTDAIDGRSDLNWCNVCGALMGKDGKIEVPSAVAQVDALPFTGPVPFNELALRIAAVVVREFQFCERLHTPPLRAVITAAVYKEALAVLDEKDALRGMQPISYLLSYHDRNALVIECVNYERFDAWVIRDSIGNVLPRAGEWQYEPRPSSRTDEFIKETRYKSAAEAFDRWQARLRGDAWSGQ